MSKTSMAKHARAIANLLAQSDEGAIQISGHALAMIAPGLATGRPWTGGEESVRTEVAAVLEAAGVSKDNIKRSTSKCAALLNPEHAGYVPGLLEAACKGNGEALAHLAKVRDKRSPEGITSQYLLIKRVKTENGDHDPLARIAAALVKREKENTLAKDWREIMRAVAKSPEAWATLVRTTLAVAQQAGVSTVATKAAPKATSKPKAGKPGKPLTLNGGSANGLQHKPKAAPARRRTLTTDGAVELVTVDRGNAH